MHIHSWSQWEHDGPHFDTRYCTHPDCMVGQSLCVQTHHVTQYRVVNQGWDREQEVVNGQ